MVPARSHRRPHAQRLLPQCHGPCRSRRRSGAPGSRGLPKPRAPRSQTLRIPAPRRSPGPPPFLRLRCLLLPASHLPHAPRHLRQRLRNRLHPPPRLALALPGLSRRALRFQPRFACLDSYPSFRHCRTDSPPVARAALRRSVPRRLPGFLSIHRVLSRLGGHLFLRQPFFRFAHRAFHPRPRRFSRSGRAIFPLSARRLRRRSPRLSLQAQSPHAEVRRPRPQAARKKSLASLIRLRSISDTLIKGFSISLGAFSRTAWPPPRHPTPPSRSVPPPSASSRPAAFSSFASAKSGLTASSFISSSGATSRSATNKPPSASSGSFSSRFSTCSSSLSSSAASPSSPPTAFRIPFFISPRSFPGPTSPTPSR